MGKERKAPSSQRLQFSWHTKDQGFLFMLHMLAFGFINVVQAFRLVDNGTFFLHVVSVTCSCPTCNFMHFKSLPRGVGFSVKKIINYKDNL